MLSRMHSLIDYLQPVLSFCYLVAWGRDRTSDRAAAACEGLWLGRRGAAAAGRGVVVPGVVLVHDPGKRKISVHCLSSESLFLIPDAKKAPTGKKILWFEKSLISKAGEKNKSAILLL